MKAFLVNIVDNHIFKYLNKIPGEKRFGNYRFLPLFFLAGASLEFLMINWKVGPHKVNFYTTLKRKQAERVIDEKEKLETLLANKNKEN